MKSMKLLPLLLVSVLLVGCKENAELPCQKTGFTDKPVCPVSFFQALGNTNYDHRVVRISGFLRTKQVNGSPKSFLYFSKEQADIQNTSGALEVGSFAQGVKPVRLTAYQKVLSTSDNAYVEIIGEISYLPTTGMDVPAAKVSDLVGVRVVP